VAFGSDGYLRTLTTIDNDIFWLHASLQHAHFRMLASAPEQPWRFYSEVTNLFFVAINSTVAIYFNKLLIFSFLFLQTNMQ